MLDAFFPNLDGLSNRRTTQVFEVKFLLTYFIQIIEMKGVCQYFTFTTDNELGHRNYDIDKLFIFVQKQLIIVNFRIYFYVLVEFS